MGQSPADCLLGDLLEAEGSMVRLCGGRGPVRWGREGRLRRRYRLRSPGPSWSLLVGCIEDGRRSRTLFGGESGLESSRGGRSRAACRERVR